MQRNIATYAVAHGQSDTLKNKMLNWCQPFGIFLFLDSNGYTDKYGRYECLLAAGAYDLLPAGCDLDKLYEYHDRHHDWLFGHIAYDYKNQLEPRLKTTKPAVTSFDQLLFFRPEVVCYINQEKTQLTIETIGLDPNDVFAQINAAGDMLATTLPQVLFTATTKQQHYLNAVETLRQHIKEGDCYEINYCNEYHAINVEMEPLHAFSVLNNLSHAPFAAYYRNVDKYMMSASPERYLVKRGGVLISQPIKGTARRGEDPATDDRIKEQLYDSVKDRAENVMITDLVRNDLARSCEVGTVKAEELFGIYTFPQVHQMISTVTGELDINVPFTDAIRYSFPMGSMTGAPKIKVMELIDRYEDVARNLFSGTVGYITPQADFDFNVIIRSLFYNRSEKRLSYQAGGAITYDSSAQGEWEEMRLKAWALEKVFNQ